jgi:peptide/nickel transport system permease protein
MGATLLVFLLMRVVPGDVALLILVGPADAGDVTNAFIVKEEDLERIREQLGLNKPLAIQYLDWIIRIPTGNFGNSILTDRPIINDIGRGAVVTIQLALMSLILGTVMGLPLGVISALKQDSFIDVMARIFSIVFHGIPTFWLALVVLLVGQKFFDWSPPIGRNLLWERPMDNFLQMIFPALIIGSHLMAAVARMSRTSMLDVLREDYVRTARAKGLKESVVIVRHALRNALIPVVTIISVYLGALLGGTVIVELIFTIPGLGRLMLDAINMRDYPVVQALVFVLAAGYIFINLFVDILYGWLDPRISVESQ